MVRFVVRCVLDVSRYAGPASTGAPLRSGGRGEFQRAGELRLQMDTYGITPKGQQDRRWKPAKSAPSSPRPTGSHYGHLKAV